MCTIQGTGAEVLDSDIHMLRCGVVTGLSERADTINTGQNSGYQALEIARLSAACRALLLGYDMQYAPDGKSHWHGGHPVAVPEVWYSHNYARNFDAYRDVEGFAVFNASRVTKLTQFPRVTVEELLP